MNPDDIIKAAPAIAKGAGALAAAIPLTPIIKAILGDAADELGQRFGDRVRLYRYGRSLEMLKKAEEMAEDAGFSPKAVPIKLLFPLLEGASFEENEDLHTMWAALLANAASPENAEKVRPGFISTLKQMAPDEASLLKALYDHALNEATELPDSHKPASLAFTGDRINKLSESLGQSLITTSVCLDRLQSQHLLQRRFDAPKAELFLLTISGCLFITACRPPKPKS